MALAAEKERYTFADILAWDENERIEIIDGEAVMMAPPSRIHQKISFEIGRQIGACLRKTGMRRVMLIRWWSRIFP